MSRIVTIVVFLALQTIVLVVFLAGLMPLTGANAPPLISETLQVWSGGARADVVDSFRTGPTESAAPFRPDGGLMWASLSLIASLAAGMAGWMVFVRGRTWLSAGFLAAALALGAGAAFLIITHWGGSVLYPPGAVNTAWLYMATRAFLAQFFIGYILLVVAAALVLMEVVRPERQLGLPIVAANWAVVVITWLGAYVGLYVAPVLIAGA